jgi:hypothetical protein
MIFIRIKTKQKDLTKVEFDSIIVLLSTTQWVFCIMNQLDQLLEIISDPFDGPEEGVDFWVDEQGYIQVNEVYTAALIMRKANISKLFDKKLVKVGQRGDSILLGFDTLLDVTSVYTANIGFKNDTLAEVKQDTDGKFCLYLNKKRHPRLFKKLASAKSFLKKLDKELQFTSTESESFDDLLL